MDGNLYCCDGGMKEENLGLDEAFGLKQGDFEKGMRHATAYSTDYLKSAVACLIPFSVFSIEIREHFTTYQG